MNKVKISIIVPVYNVELYLERCLISLVNQTIKEIEIILINDGSTDSSGQICNEYAEKDCRVKIIHKKNEGASIARNIGLEIACGKYICFVDGDDYVEKDGFERMYNIAINKSVDIVLFNHYIGEDKINIVNFPKGIVKTGEELRKSLVKSNTEFFLPYSWRNIFKNTKKQRKIRFKFNLKYGEDSLYNLMSYLNASSIYCSDEAFYHYMPNSNSTMSRKKENLLYYLSNLYNEKINLYTEYNLLEFKKDLYKYTIQHTLNLLIDDVIKYEDLKNYRNRFNSIGESKMILESFKGCNINLNDIKMTYNNKKITKYIKEKKYWIIPMFIIFNKKILFLRDWLNIIKRKILMIN